MDRDRDDKSSQEREGSNRGGQNGSKSAPGSNRGTDNSERDGHGRFTDGESRGSTKGAPASEGSHSSPGGRSSGSTRDEED